MKSDLIVYIFGEKVSRLIVLIYIILRTCYAGNCAQKTSMVVITWFVAIDPKITKMCIYIYIYIYIYSCLSLTSLSL